MSQHCILVIRETFTNSVHNVSTSLYLFLQVAVLTKLSPLSIEHYNYALITADSQDRGTFYFWVTSLILIQNGFKSPRLKYYKSSIPNGVWSKLCWCSFSSFWFHFWTWWLDTGRVLAGDWIPKGMWQMDISVYNDTSEAIFMEMGSYL